LPPRGEVLIRGAYVMTMDAALGDLPGADILVRNGEVVEVGADLQSRGAEVIDAANMIALPGFVDTHWHLWNSTLRATLSYADPGNGYFPLTMRLGPLSTPRDAYCNVRMALAEALLSGITTVHNWAHNIRTPAHADAEIRAMQEMGIRGRFSYGWGQDFPVDRPMDGEDVDRARQAKFDGDDLLSLGVALRTPVAYQRGNVPIEVLKQDCAGARALGLPVTMHNRPGAVALLEEHDLLGPDLLLVHPQGFSPEELSLLVAKRVKISCSPMVENARGANGPRGPIQLSELLAGNVEFGLSVDEVVTGGRLIFSR
jgi:cytosine/adenosine deaminase-related metal-dependent hydrolase